MNLVRDNQAAALLLAAVTLAGWGLWAVLPSYLPSLLLLIGINCLLAVSLNLVNGITGQFSLGHAGFMAVGAYTAAWLSTGPLQGLFATPAGAQVGLLLTVSAGTALAALAGWVVGQPSLRLKGDYLAIVTLGFGEIIRVAVLNTPALGGAIGLFGVPAAGGAPWIFFCLAATCLGCYRLMESSPGRALLSVRENEVAAEALGINTTALKVGAFAASAGVAGLAGALYAHVPNVITPSSFGFTRSVEIVVMVVLGGMGSMSGALLAAVLLTLLPEALRPLKELTGVDLRMVLYSLALVLLMLKRPGGLLGRKELWEMPPFRRRRSPPPPADAGTSPQGGEG